MSRGQRLNYAEHRERCSWEKCAFNSPACPVVKGWIKSANSIERRREVSLLRPSAVATVAAKDPLKSIADDTRRRMLEAYRAKKGMRLTYHEIAILLGEKI